LTSLLKVIVLADATETAIVDSTSGRVRFNHTQNKIVPRISKIQTGASKHFPIIEDPLDIIFVLSNRLGYSYSAHMNSQ